MKATFELIINYIEAYVTYIVVMSMALVPFESNFHICISQPLTS